MIRPIVLTLAAVWWLGLWLSWVSDTGVNW